MFEQHDEAGKLYESEEVFDVVFSSCGQSAVVLHPGEEAFDFPAATIAAQRASWVLCLRLDRLGEIISMPYSLICSSCASES
jgi:hypothetical protein